MVIQELRYGLRLLAKSPGFTITAVLAIALGIGANTAIFSAVYGLILGPLPYAEADRLVTLWSWNPSIHISTDQLPVSSGDMFEVRDQNTSFDSMATFGKRALTLLAKDGPIRIEGIRVTGDFFRLLGVTPFLGRLIGRDDCVPGKDRVVLLSHGFWNSEFAADRKLVGNQIRLDGEQYTVIGVMPEGFAFPRGPELPAFYGLGPETQMWVPDPATAQMAVRGRTLVGLARLKKGVTVARARSDLQAIAKRLEQYPPNKGFGFLVLPLKEHFVKEIRASLWMLFGAVGFILLISWANVANLQLARGAVRRREMALRSALGAGRSSLIRQLLIENLLLGALGGLVGLGLGWALLRFLIRIVPGTIPRVNEVGLNFTVLAFTAAVSIFASMLFGLAPALHLSKSNLAETMKQGGEKGTVGFGSRLRNALVVCEVGLSMMLLVSAVLLVRSFNRLQDVQAGFKADSLTSFEVFTTSARTKDLDVLANFYVEVLNRLRALPQVQSAGAVSHLPLANEERTYTIAIEGRPDDDANNDLVCDAHSATPGYFETMGIRLVRGRFFNDGDGRKAPLVALVNETFVRSYFTGEDPIGRRITFDSKKAKWYTIVGVIGDIHHSGLDNPPHPQVLRPYTQDPYVRAVFVMRSNADRASLVSAARKVVASVDPNQPVSKVRTLEEVRDRSLAGRRFNTALIGGFALLALILSIIGLYGTIAYLVAQRTNEIGVRLALGASPSHVLNLVLKQGLVLSLAGVLIGTAGAYAIAKLLDRMLFGVGGHDPVSIALAVVTMLVVASIATLIAGRRATSVDPAVALRYE